MIFRLSTGLAGEILKKLRQLWRADCDLRRASHYTDKSLKDVIYESSKRKTAFFIETEEETVTR